MKISIACYHLVCCNVACYYSSVILSFKICCMSQPIQWYAAVTGEGSTVSRHISQGLMPLRLSDTDNSPLKHRYVSLITGI